MPLFNIFEVAGSGMSAQQARLNTTASNLANANNVASSAEAAYKARHPVFAAVLDAARDGANAQVQVVDVVQSQSPPQREYAPHHPLADPQGYVYRSNVNPVEEMANMISASRSFQNNVEVMNTSKQLLLQTLALGESK